MKYQGLKNFCLGLYIYTLLIILWGAWVRISKSGDGCGDSWPLCGNQWLPEIQSIATWIEFSHRLTTGLFGILVLGLFLYIYKRFSSSFAIRGVAWLVLVFTITEALIGALLVKMGLVAGNDSFLRLAYMSLHQLNSVFLTGFIGLLYLMLKKQKIERLNFSKDLYWIAGLFLTIMALGPLASLSTTLYPSEYLMEGFLTELKSGQHWIVRFRILHPLLALIFGGGLTYFVLLKYIREKKREYYWLLYLLVISILFGMATLLFLYPTWMKLGHLLLAHLLWLAIMNLLLKD